MEKRLLSVLLVLVLLLLLLPAGAVAAEPVAFTRVVIASTSFWVNLNCFPQDDWRLIAAAYDGQGRALQVAMGSFAARSIHFEWDGAETVKIFLVDKAMQPLCAPWEGPAKITDEAYKEERKDT